MRNIWTVFKTDIRTLSRCFFACVVVVAIALLPSLYAWLNIYSNWDPYGNTGGISIAVASLDEGYTDEDGVYENKGQDVVDDLREATSINWVIVDTEEQAKGGVESGDYYAAVVIDKEFSRNMFRMLTDWTGKPAITYYENAKKNAVATKITDTAVETLKRSISENYLEVVIGGIMEQGNLLAEDLTADDPESAVKGVLYQAQDLLNACGNMMDAFEKAGSSGGVPEKDAAALEEAYRNRLLKGKFPGCVLHITLPVDTVDVNVHPAKTVVKFAGEKAVFDAVYYTVRDVLDNEGKPKPAEKPFYQTMTAQEFLKRPDAPRPDRAVTLPVGRAVGSAPAGPAVAEPVRPAPAPVTPVMAVHDVVRQPDKPFTAPAPAGQVYHITPPVREETVPAPVEKEPEPTPEPEQQELGQIHPETGYSEIYPVAGIQNDRPQSL